MSEAETIVSYHFLLLANNSNIHQCLSKYGSGSNEFTSISKILGNANSEVPPKQMSNLALFV